MQINVTGHHLEITNSLKQYIEEKFTRLERHFDQIKNAQVILTVEKNQQIAEAKLLLSGTQLFATADDSDMYAAIDCLIDKLDRQVIKHKEKQKKH